MTPHTPHLAPEDLALYAFGLLERDQAAEIDFHLSAGCAVCSRELQAFENVAVELAQPAAPPPELKHLLFDRIRRPVDSPEEPEPGLVIHRAGTGKWQPTPWKGITYRRLHHDPATGMVTSLLRVKPGGRYPAHRHRAAEQSWVLEGSCRIGSITIRAGDFAAAAAGTVHGVLESDEGCLLLIVSSAKDEILA